MYFFFRTREIRQQAPKKNIGCIKSDLMSMAEMFYLCKLHLLLVFQDVQMTKEEDVSTQITIVFLNL